jgi:predicted RNase H-like HicB family nuclease
MKITVQAEFRLFGTIKRQGGWYVAHCPPLDITTQGKTEDEARRNLIEASELFVISCFERGTFEQALRELGWHVVPAGSVARIGEKGPVAVPPGAFGFPIPIPFGFEKAAGCHA